MKFSKKLSLLILMIFSLTSSPLFAKEKNKNLAQKNGLMVDSKPNEKSRGAGKHDPEESSMLDHEKDSGPATPQINPEEESAEDREFLNTSESADFEEIEVEN